MKLIAPLLLGLTLASMAHANLGETPDEFRARYGLGDSITETDPTTADGGLRRERFTLKGYQIEILFSNVVLQETYFPEDTFSEDQITLFLERNREGRRWKQRVGTQRRSWIRDDGAEANLTQNCFIFRSKQLLGKEKDWINQRGTKQQNL